MSERSIGKTQHFKSKEDVIRQHLKWLDKLPLIYIQICKKVKCKKFKCMDYILI